LTLDVGSGAWVRSIAYIGSHSYSIYLWHMAVQIWIMRRIVDERAHWGVYLFLYVTLSIAIGIGMSLLVEFPVLRARDRWFPSRSRPLNVGDAGAHAGTDGQRASPNLAVAGTRDPRASAHTAASGE
jgi:peptidoglycan/LPS O-acetylase OafA/YrhL